MNEDRHIWLFRVGPRVQRFYKNLSAIREALVKKLVSGWPYPALWRKSPRASSKTSSVPPRSKGGKFKRNDGYTRVSNLRRKRRAEDSPVPVEGEAQQFEGDPVLYPRYDPRYQTAQCEQLVDYSFLACAHLSETPETPRPT